MKPPKNYFLYVGNAYPHKNLERLIQAVSKLGFLDFKLILVGKEDYFYKRLKTKAKKVSLEGKVIFYGGIGRGELSYLYKNAQGLILPSLMEGFGLPGLEAMAAGCPVICSDIPVFREIYGEAANYFDPYDIDDIAEKIKKVIGDTRIRETLREKGFKQVRKYSWQKMAKQTIKAYREATSSAYREATSSAYQDAIKN